MDGGASQKTIINQMMLRFRPIAPKPVAGGDLAGDAPPDGKSSNVTNGRSKKRYVRIRKNRSKREKVMKPKDYTSERLNKPAVVTLQLLPESPKNGGDAAAIDLAVPIWLKMNNPMNGHVAEYGGSDRTVVKPPARMVESWVTVECVTDTCMMIGGVGDERIEDLEKDTCPGFVSDSMYRVKWVNEAYKRMVVGPRWEEEGGGGDSPPEVVVRVAVKEELPARGKSFSCRVSVVQYMQNNRTKKQTMPCDVWRIDFVGLAWRLDVKAALSLGR